MRYDVSQKERLKTWLAERWVCGTEMLEAHIPRYAARIYEIKGELTSMVIVKRKCENRSHSHWSVQFQWKIMRPTEYAEYRQGRLFDGS